MECIEARALKSSFFSEKSIQQALFDDFWSGIDTVVNTSSDEFSVDDLLDFSGKDFADSGEEFSEEDEEKDFLSVSSRDNDVNAVNCSSFSSSGDLGSFPAGELHVPVDDMENLEWLSQIVDDSSSELSLLCPPACLTDKAGNVAVNRPEAASRSAVHTFTILGLPYSVPKKPRTNRSKKLGRFWSRIESTPTPSSSHDSSITPVQSTELGKPPAKKPKKNSVFGSGSGSDGSGQRRCTHCQVQKTPQWRTGPLGPKTLCNACGVRFKSGRLFPEYRPACSPTFSGDVHSNSHRKVLEMRKKKEPGVDERGLVPMVWLFLNAVQ